MLGNQGGRAFCAGANIFVVLAAAGSKAWDPRPWSPACSRRFSEPSAARAPS